MRHLFVNDDQDLPGLYRTGRDKGAGITRSDLVWIFYCFQYVVQVACEFGVVLSDVSPSF